VRTWSLWIFALALAGAVGQGKIDSPPSDDSTFPYSDADTVSTYASHPPTRALPKPSDRPMGDGAAYFVDPDGNDRNDGSKASPWRTLKHAIDQLRAGDTIYLRGGVHWAYGQVHIGPENSGEPGAPVTIRSYPGELAVVDFGFREFFEDPAGSWEPYPDGSEGEYWSTQTYPGLMPQHLGGNFGDSMVPLFRYRFIEDLRSENEYAAPGLANRRRSATGIYAGPGPIWNNATQRIHIRLRPTMVTARGGANYRGETDPRKIRLVISRAGDEASFRISHASHVNIYDLVIRGSDEGSVTVGGASSNIELDGLWIYGGGPALKISGSNIRVLHSRIRGFDAPWHSRFHDKNRRSGDNPLVRLGGTDLELAYNEFTDAHDGIFFEDEGPAPVEDLVFHHNLVSNMNDDCLFMPVKKETGVIWMYQNTISGCSTALSHSGGGVGVIADEGVGNYVFRNVFDLRRFPYKEAPRADDPTDDGTYDSKLAGEHSNPSVWAPYYFYHNTVISWDGPQSGGKTYGLEMGQKTRHTIRRLFNNIFVQIERRPFQDLPPADHDFEAGGNLFWSVRDGSTGYHPKDIHADPQFEAFTDDWRDETDLRLRADSPAINAGVELPATWPDPLRELDEGAPDLGALPLGVDIEVLPFNTPVHPTVAVPDRDSGRAAREVRAGHSGPRRGADSSPRERGGGRQRRP
jgi:hypothetical protein